MDSKIDVIYCRYSSCAMLAALGVGASDEQVAIVLDASEPEAADVVLLGLRAEPELPAVGKRWEPRRRRK